MHVSSSCWRWLWKTHVALFSHSQKMLNNFLFGCFKCLRDKAFTPDAGAALLNFLDESYEQESGSKSVHGAYEKAASFKHKIEHEEEKLTGEILENLKQVHQLIKDYKKRREGQKPEKNPNIEPTK